MKVKNKAVQKLLKKYKEISILGNISALLGWDLNVNLPSAAIEDRAGQSAYLAKLITEKWEDINLPRVVSTLHSEESAILRNLKQGAKFYHNVPKEIIVEFEETSNRAYMAWVESRRKDDFSIFEPYLTKMVRFNQLIAEHYGYSRNPYDALLDMHEVGLATTEVRKIFDNLTPKLIKLLKKIKISKAYKNKFTSIDNSVYSEENQIQLCNFVLRKMGYNFEKGRMDVSPHPFTTNFGITDVRITNRYNVKDFRESLSVAMHEGGHALYEQGVNPEYSNTPLEGGVSLGIHESQSRFWENIIGRSEEFVEFITPILHTLFSDSLSKVAKFQIYEFLNQVRPTLIRTEADEVTYNLHVAIRFEIEEALINNKIKVDEVPKIWNQKYKKYLGIVPKSDANGCLQDVHWSQGLMGYFPTYTLGNLYSAQFANKMRTEIDVDGSIKRGELGTILSWLRSNIHQYGSLYLPKDLVKKVTGEPLNPKYFIKYLDNKYSKLYHLTSM